MHVNRIIKSSLALASAAVMLTACGGVTDSATGPKPGDVLLNLGNALDQVTTGVVQTELFKVCKAYTGGGATPAVTIDVSAVDNDDAAVIGVTSVSLTDGQCKNVWIAGGTGATVTVTEQVPANYTPSWEKWDDLGDNLEAGTLDASGAGNQVSGVVTGSVPAGGAGTTIRFTNTYTPPPDGCTYTQGFWKTHSSYGPAGPADDTWLDAYLANGPDTPFYLSGQTWYEVFWTAPGGNAYYNLAHQYMAAKLNELSGASVPQNVADAISDAEALFAAYTPAQIAALKGNDSLRQQFVALAGILGSYNEGLIGPGHCGDEVINPI